MSAVDVSDPWVALGDPTRRRVFAHVADRPRSVTEIANELPVSRPAVSQHLKVLAAAELVTATKVGRERIYRARTDGLAAMRAELDRFWSQALTNFRQIAESDEPGGNDDDRHDQ